MRSSERVANVNSIAAVARAATTSSPGTHVVLAGCAYWILLGEQRVHCFKPRVVTDVLESECLGLRVWHVGSANPPKSGPCKDHMTRGSCFRRLIRITNIFASTRCWEAFWFTHGDTCQKYGLPNQPPPPPPQCDSLCLDPESRYNDGPKARRRVKKGIRFYGRGFT